MSYAAKRLRLSFQTKVLVPVLAVLVLGTVSTLWVVGRHLGDQTERQAEQALTTARGVVERLLAMRAQSVRERFRTIVSEPRFKATVQKGDVETLTKQLDALFGEIGEDTEFLVILSPTGERLASVQRDRRADLAAFGAAVQPLSDAAFEGLYAGAVVEASGRLFHAVAVPMYLSEGGTLLGVWVAGVSLGQSQIADLAAIAGTEILLFGSDGRVLDGTLRPAGGLNGNDLIAGGEVGQIEIDRRHYLILAGAQRGGEGVPPFSFALLASEEDWREALAATRKLLVGFGLIGLVVAVGLVSWVIRRITQPLVMLRDRAEAVGRGDFTQRVEVVSNDETGALAIAFNSMTDNLQASRAELERTLQTLRGTQAQLVQSEKLSAVGQFVAGVAHELNNPLTSVVGYAEILALDPSHAEAKTYLQRIAQAAERCRKIVQNLLGFSRQHPPERRPLRLIEVCDAVLEFLAYEMRHSGVKVEKHFPSELPRILGDTHQLQQVVLNLVNNARQALEEFRPDGVIRLIAESDGEAGRVRLRICDNGPGIAPEHRSRLFDPFFTTKAEGKGTGLGLSLCYGLVQEHRGTIVVVSERGQGAEFVLEFPVLGDAPAIVAVDLAAVGGTGATFAGMAGKGRAALVIDDEIWIRDVAAEVLRGEGYTVETAESGEDGLGKLRKAAYDLVVCDWKMPGLNGMALYERVRAENAEQARGFLFMTGDMVSDGFMTFLRKYNRPCLPKPFAPRELRAVVSKLAAGT